MTSENWDPPSFVVAVRHPEIRKAWADRCRAWDAANPEISTAWAEASREAEDRQRRAHERYEAVCRVRASGISERATRAFAAGLDKTPATQAVETFIGSGRTFLLLMGSAGAGKTLACTLALARRGMFVRALELARLSVYEQNDRFTLESAHKASTLVIDDLGAENLHDGWRPVLDELIDIRWGNQRKTIITTNLDKTAFKARYGERISDRIRDDGFIETCGDTSRRGRGQ